MSTVTGEIKFPPRTYLTAEELALPENQRIEKVDLKTFTEIHPCVAASVEGSKIVEFFNGKSVFLTGATGFIGKLLIEKLLRTCKDIEKIYILVRPKKGQDPQTRMDKTFEDPVFSVMKKMVSNYKDKMTLIEGDISEPNLGISRENRQILIEKVNVILHGAATVNFNSPLRKAASINVKGTKEIMLLAQQCENLVSFVHISTAFSYCCVGKEIKEELYDAPYNTDEFLRMIEENTDEYLLKNQKSIIGDWPNTYAFTKGLGEDVVRNMAGNIPTSICRPSVVVSTYREPIRNWTDNLYGPMGIAVGCGMGILRINLQDTTKTFDVIPGDIVANGILAVAYQNTFKSDRQVKIFNLASTTQNSISMGHFNEVVLHYGAQTPSIKSIWYTVYIAVTNIYLFYVIEFFVHFIPAVLIDCALTIRGKKRRMVEVTKKIKTLLILMSYFTLREWKIYNENVKSLWKSLPEKDKEIFNFSMDPADFNWNTWMNGATAGIKVYMLKEDLSTIPAAKKRFQRLYLMHIALKTLMFILSSTVAYFIFKGLLDVII